MYFLACRYNYIDIYFYCLGLVNDVSQLSDFIQTVPGNTDTHLDNFNVKWLCWI